VSSYMIDKWRGNSGEAIRGAGGVQVVRRCLIDGSFGFGSEESAGASFLRMDGTVLDHG